MDRLDAAALIHRDVHDDRALLHGRDHVLRHEARRAGAGDEHGADEQIGAAEHLLHVEAVRHQRDDLPAEDVVQVPEPVGVHVEHRDVGAEAHGGARGVETCGAGAEDDDVPRRDAGHAGEEDAAAAVGAAEVERALLDREPAGDLAHRREQRQAAVGALDRLVGDRDRPRGPERARDVRRGRQVEVGEERLLGAEPGVLGRQRLLHLQHELGALPDLVDGDERRAHGRVFVVADPAARAGAALDQHAVARLGEGARTGRREGDALLARLDLARHADDHGALNVSPRGAWPAGSTRLGRCAGAAPERRLAARR